MYIVVIILYPNEVKYEKFAILCCKMRYIYDPCVRYTNKRNFYMLSEGERSFSDDCCYLDL